MGNDKVVAFRHFVNMRMETPGGRNGRPTKAATYNISIADWRHAKVSGTCQSLYAEQHAKWLTRQHTRQHEKGPLYKFFTSSGIVIVDCCLLFVCNDGRTVRSTKCRTQGEWSQNKTQREREPGGNKPAR
jgi:hypothetical protein